MQNSIRECVGHSLRRRTLFIYSKHQRLRMYWGFRLVFICSWWEPRNMAEILSRIWKICLDSCPINAFSSIESANLVKCTVIHKTSAIRMPVCLKTTSGNAQNSNPKKYKLTDCERAQRIPSNTYDTPLAGDMLLCHWLTSPSNQNAFLRRL